MFNKNNSKTKYLLLSLLFSSPILAQINIDVAHNRFNQADSQQEECSICMDNMDNSNTVYLDCRHNFHESCLRSWLERNNTCPLCRAEFGEASIHQHVNAEPVELQQELINSEIKNELFQELQISLTRYDSEDIHELLELAYENPYMLLTDDFIGLLNQYELNLIDQIILEEENLNISALDNQIISEQENINNSDQDIYNNNENYKPLDITELNILQELAQSFESEDNADIDSLLIDATTNPMLLINKSWFTGNLTDYQRNLVNEILVHYIERD